MVQRGGRMRLLLESVQTFGVGGDGSGQDFDGHVAARRGSRPR